MRDDLKSLSIVLALLGLTACGSASLLGNPDAGQLPAPVLLSVGGSGKVTAGVPEGISVTWTRIDNPHCQGYYLYRYTDANRPPEPGPDDNPPFPTQLRVNDGELIPQPAEGATVTFNDYFPAVIGETYYYRVTAVDDQDPPQESYPSAEKAWTVHGHAVTGLDPTAAYWGDDVTISGDTFGEYDEGTDFARFAGLGGELDGAIVSWTDTEIVVTVPEGALTGPVKIVIAGGFAETDEDLVILQPTILSIDPDVCFVECDLTLDGLNFGAEQAESTVFIGARDVSAQVHSWADTEIVLTVPVDIAPGDVQVTVAGRASNTLPFAPRPEILAVDPPNAQPDEVVSLSGRQFGDEQGRVLLDDAAELTVEDWAADAVHFALVGSVGPHTLSVESAPGHMSNSVPYTIVPRLTVSFSGLDEGTLYRASDAPEIVVVASEDADRVELVVDDQLMGEAATASPFAGLELNLGALRNGPHNVKVKAYRRAISVESPAVRIIVYSLVGDLNADGAVDFADREALVALIGMSADDPLFFPWYDTDEDGEVTEADLSAIGYHWREAVAP